jgi:hypothetical protein
VTGGTSFSDVSRDTKIGVKIKSLYMRYSFLAYLLVSILIGTIDNRLLDLLYRGRNRTFIKRELFF